MAQTQPDDDEMTASLRKVVLALADLVAADPKPDPATVAELRQLAELLDRRETRERRNHVPSLG